uniref:Ovochymase 1 n=1 Tax=Otolemur garnettii TaxID=30611 RepID=H0XV05_OTOGA
MGALVGAGFLLLLVVGVSRSSGLECGISAPDLERKEPAVASGVFSRISSWRNSAVGSHPWQVSLKLGEHHFCGGSLIQDDQVVTAAHCLVSLNAKQLKSLTVTSGKYNLFQKDKQEQNVPVSKIIIHPEYNSLGFMSSDIALLYLTHKVKFGTAAQPIYLPNRDHNLEAGILCVASGWGKISETSARSNVLQEVELTIMDDRTCNAILKRMNLPALERTMLCAGFLDGGMDACQRDSGGPLVCRRGGGIWTLAGITSWVAGCAGDSASVRNRHRKASLGIFSKVLELMDFITQNMITGGFWSRQTLLKTSLSSITKGLSSVPGVRGSQEKSGKIIYPYSKEDNYSHNCISFFLSDVNLFSKLYIISTDGEKGKGKVCEDTLPSPLLTETREASVTFVSDTENSGNGYNLTFAAVRNSEAGPGCWSVAVLVEGTVRSADFPDLYPSHVQCHQLIRALDTHTVKLTFEAFTFEFNPNHIYDAAVIYGDSKEDHELAKLSRILNTLIFSPSNMTVVCFKENDGKGRGVMWKIRVNSQARDSSNKIEPTSPPQTIPVSAAKAIPYGICGIPPFSPQWLSRRIAGGEEACPHCWPWQVGLRFLGDHQCGGAIISPTWVLTAAHCVQSKDNPLSWTIIAGDHDRTLKESTEQVRRAKHIIVHEDFNILSYDSDIALVQLSSPLEYNAAVRPVCLPHGPEPLFSLEICAVTGWGSISKDGDLASRLQQIQVSVLEREACEHTYYSAHSGGITANMICAGSAASAGKDFCQGDSGGPLVCRHENGPFTVYGIVSWGAGCVQPWKPGIFARVTVFLDWIYSKIKGPTSFRTSNKSKTLEQQLPPLVPSTDSASGPGCDSEVELDERRGFFSTPSYPLDYRGKLECSWVLRNSPNSVAKFTVEYLLLPGSCVPEPHQLIPWVRRHTHKGSTCGSSENRDLGSQFFMSSAPLVRVTFHPLVQGAFGINYIVFKKIKNKKDGKITRASSSSNQEPVVTFVDFLLTKPVRVIVMPRNISDFSHLCCHGQWGLVAPLNHIISLDVTNFQMKLRTLACPFLHIRKLVFGSEIFILISFLKKLGFIILKNVIRQKKKERIINEVFFDIWNIITIHNVRSVGQKIIKKKFASSASYNRIQHKGAI